jgi:hypothetical protein
MVYPALLPLMHIPRGPVVDWTDSPRRFKWTRPFRRKTKSGFRVCVITFQTQSTISLCVISWYIPQLLQYSCVSTNEVTFIGCNQTTEICVSYKHTPVGIATKLRAGLPRNLGKILGKAKAFIVFSFHPNLVCVPPTLQLNGYSGPFTSGKDAVVWSW